MERFTYNVSFRESVFDGDGRMPIIRNVVLLGSESKNKRRYTPACLRAAVPLFEGVQAYVNHPTVEEERRGLRDVRWLAGKFVNVRYEDVKIRGDFHGLPDDPAAKKFVAIAETMPELAGMSQSAQGRIRWENGVQIVEAITKVFSVDLVANPATTNGFFEGHDMGRVESAKLDEIARKLKAPSFFSDTDKLVGDEHRSAPTTVDMVKVKRIARRLRGLGDQDRDEIILAVRL